MPLNPIELTKIRATPATYHTTFSLNGSRRDVRLLQPMLPVAGPVSAQSTVALR